MEEASVARAEQAQGDEIKMGDRDRTWRVLWAMENFLFQANRKHKGL